MSQDDNNNNSNDDELTKAALAAAYAAYYYPLSKRLGSGFPRGGGSSEPVFRFTSSNPSGSYAEDGSVGDTLMVENNVGSVTFGKTGTDAGLVTLDTGTGVWSIDSIDYETKTVYSFSLTANDGSETITQVVSITITNVPEATLSALTLSATTVEESVAQGTAIGTVQNGSSGATITLQDSDGGRFQLVSGEIQAGPTEILYSEGTPRTLTLRETHPDGTNSPRDTDIDVTVTEVSDYGTDGRFKILITADKDYANERDDEAANAIWFANQDKFNVLGLIYDALDGIAPPDTGSNEDLMLDAYESDYATVSTWGSEGQFKSRAELQALVVQGPQADAPRIGGYWQSGDTEFAEAEAAADLILQQAAAFGDPAGTFATNPKGKLLVISQGGAASMAHALYRAVQLGELPDICDRVVWLVQSKHNSWTTPNTWKAIMAEHWQADGVPGDYGGLEIINPCWLAHACNNEGTVATENWRYVVDMAATGAALETERAASNYPNLYFRAGDAWFCWFLFECDRLGVYDPTNINMDCGYLRTIEDGTRYPWQTGVWGPSNAAGGWSTTGTTDSPWSPNHYIPLDGITGLSQAVAAVDLTSWYGTVVRPSLARYKVTASEGGDYPTIVAAMTNAWGMTEGSGQSVANKVSGKTALRLGSSSGADAADPSWVTGGVDIVSGDYLYHPGTDTAMDGTAGHTWAFMSKLNAVSGSSNQTLLGRDHTTAALRQRQMRYVNGNLNDLIRYGASTSNTQTDNASTVDTNWSLSVGHLNRNLAMSLRVDGVQVDTDTLGGTPNAGTGIDITFGSRVGADSLNGIMGFIGHFRNLPEAELPNLEAYVISQFEADHPSVTHGITLP